MNWCELSVHLSGELAEALSEVIHRYAPGSVVIDQLEYDQVRLRSYLPIDGDYDATLRSIEEGIWHLSQINPIPDLTFHTIKSETWADRWKEHFHPLLIGERLIILPVLDPKHSADEGSQVNASTAIMAEAWIRSETDDRLPILIEPGMAFGTGTHPTTQLCLQALEQYLQPGARVTDLGCGSGILSIGAVRLGASKVHAFDIDPEAIDLTRKNVGHNQMDERIDIEEGSLEHLLREEPPAPADLLVANILTKTLIQMLSEGLADVVQSGGIFILSGILDEQVDEFSEHCQKARLELIDRLQRGDWVALCYRKKLPS